MDPTRLFGLLGTGGMGEVYRAKDLRLGREVAIKLLTAELSASQTAKERFLREGQAASAMNHPNICTLYDIGEHNGRTYLVLELLEGETLVVPEWDAGKAERVSRTEGELDGRDGLDWTPDGRIVYISAADGNSEVWIMRAQRLTSGGPNALPRVTADGGAIFYVSQNRQKWLVWKMGLDGSAATAVSDGGLEFVFDVAPDGKWLFYISGRNGAIRLWRQSLETGEATEFGKFLEPAISPDNKQLAMGDFGDEVTVRGLEGGTGARPVRLGTGSSPFSNEARSIRWTTDSKNLTYVVTANNVSNLWVQPATGGAARRVTNFTEGRIFQFAWAPDGKKLAVARGASVQNAVMISNFQHKGVP